AYRPKDIAALSAHPSVLRYRSGRGLHRNRPEHSRCPAHLRRASLNLGSGIAVASTAVVRRGWLRDILNYSQVPSGIFSARHKHLRVHPHLSARGRRVRCDTPDIHRTSFASRKRPVDQPPDCSTAVRRFPCPETYIAESLARGVSKHEGKRDLRGSRQAGTERTNSSDHRLRTLRRILPPSLSSCDAGFGSGKRLSRWSPGQIRFYSCTVDPFSPKAIWRERQLRPAGILGYYPSTGHRRRSIGTPPPSGDPGAVARHMSAIHLQDCCR